MRRPIAWTLSASLVLALAASLAAPGLAASDAKKTSEGPWIHVEVREAGDDGAEITVNLPLSLADLALKMADEKTGHGPKIHLEDTDITVEELRAMWEELRSAGDAEFVTVKENDETVRVFRKGDAVLVHVDGGEDGERVRIEMPVSVVDALLSGEGEELNIRAAIEDMKSIGKSEIVRIEDGSDFVRIWID